MKKRVAAISVLMSVILLLCGVLAACHVQNEPQKYTISFYDDIKLIDTTQTAGNEVIVLPAAPKKEGQTFGGWFLDKGTWENQLTETTFVNQALTKDVDVYAYYRQIEEPIPPTPAKHTITFYIEGEPSGRIETAGNEILTLPTAPKKDNYTFEGWYFDNGAWQNRLTENTYANQPLTEDVSVYAYYKEEDRPDPEPPQKYTVTFDVDHGTPIEPVTTSRIEEEPQTTREGYTFVDWYREDSFINRVTFPYEVTEAQTLYAKWEKTRYTVSFHTDGGTPVDDVTVSVIEKAPETTRHGYTFDGWYTDETFRNKVLFPYDVTKTQTLYAKWIRNEPEDIVFTVDLNGVLTGVSGVTESDMRVEIPSQVNGVTVREIGKEVFRDNRNIGTLIIPDSVKYLGYRMCSGCTNLREVQLPVGLTVIPDEAFEQCSSLQTINFPNALKEIRSDAFSGTALREFTAPDSLISIWNYAFKDCKDLEKVDLKNVRSLSSGAFQSCTALRSVRLPDKLTALGDNTFSGCNSLAEIDMPSCPIAIPYTIFDGTAYYTDPANWENGVLYVDGYLVAANSDFAALTEYAVKEGTIVIADNAFAKVKYSSDLKKVSFPGSLYRIGKNAFSMPSLTEIVMSDSVRSVGYGAFDGTGYYNAGENWENNGLYVGNWLVSVKNVAMTSFTVRKGTVGVADGKDTSLFPTKAQSVEQLTLPASLQYIGIRSFARLHIEDLMLPAGLKTLGEGAFSGCSSLQSVNLGDCILLESVGENAFREGNLREVTIPESVTSMGALVFNNNACDLTIRCEVAAKPDGWDKDWAYTYSSKAVITVVWKKV